MKVTLKIHPVTQADMSVLAKVMAFLAVEAEFDAPDITGLAKVKGPVTQEMIKAANEKYVAPKPPAEEQKAPVVTTPVVAPVSTPAQTSAPVVTTPDAPVVTTPPAAPAGTVDLQTLRAKTQEKIVAGFREGVKGLLEKYKIPTVVNIQPENMQAFFDDLQALK